MANCKITRASDKPLSPLRICYRDPQFELMVIDIKAHRYESTYESVANGLRYRLRDAEKQQKTAEDNVKEMRELGKPCAHYLCRRDPSEKDFF